MPNGYRVSHKLQRKLYILEKLHGHAALMCRHSYRPKEFFVWVGLTILEARARRGTTGAVTTHMDTRRTNVAATHHGGVPIATSRHPEPGPTTPPANSLAPGVAATTDLPAIPPHVTPLMTTQVTRICATAPLASAAITATGPPTRTDAGTPTRNHHVHRTRETALRIAPPEPASFRHHRTHVPATNRSGRGRSSLF